MKLAVEIVGWIGAVVILIAYALLSSGRRTGRSRLYQGMNIVGAIGFVINGWYNGALPSAVLNIVWIGIALYALMKNHRAGTAEP